MTGLLYQRGADAIIPIEACTIDGNSVTLNQPSKPHFIRKRGENIAMARLGLRRAAILHPNPYRCVLQWAIHQYQS